MSICIAKPIEADLDFAIAFSFPNLYLLSRASSLSAVTTQKYNSAHGITEPKRWVSIS